MFASLHERLPELIAVHGYWIVGLLVGLESLGIPLPGEAILITAAVYAEATGRLNILGVVAAASVGAVVGGNIGYWLGRQVRLPLLLRLGPRLGITEAKINLGRYLFDRHGGKIVFFGRFVALLRILAAILAGVNRLSWPRFFAVNAIAGVLWSALFGFAAYLLGKQIHSFTRPLGMSSTSHQRDRSRYSANTK